MAKVKKWSVIFFAALIAIVVTILGVWYLKFAETGGASQRLKVSEKPSGRGYAEIKKDVDRTIWLEDSQLDSSLFDPIIIDKPYRVALLSVSYLSGDASENDPAHDLTQKLEEALTKRSDIVLLERDEELENIFEEWALGLAHSEKSLPQAMQSADYLLVPSAYVGDNGRIAIYLKFISVRSTLVASSTFGEAHGEDLTKFIEILLERLMGGTLSEPVITDIEQLDPIPEISTTYNRALGLFQQNEIYDAAGLFMRVAHGRSSYSSDAQYWLGKCYAKMNRHRDAIAAWENYRTRHPDGSKNADIRTAIAEQRRLVRR